MILTLTLIGWPPFYESPECGGFLCDDASPPAVTHSASSLVTTFFGLLLWRNPPPRFSSRRTRGDRVQGNHWLAAEERQDGRPTSAEDYGEAPPTYSLHLVRSGNMLQLGKRTYLIETYGASVFLLLIHPDTKRTWSDVTTCKTSDVFTVHTSVNSVIKHFIFRTFYFIFLLST